MTVDLFGIPLHEFDVAITDLVLSLEAGVFAYRLKQTPSDNPYLRRLLFVFFLFLSLSSGFGGLFHAFFPDKAATLGGWIIWILVVLSIGLTASAVWWLDVFLVWGMKLILLARGLALGYVVLCSYIVLVVNYEFKTIIALYLPPMIVLTVITLMRWVLTRKHLWFLLASGLVLSFVAAAIQYLHLNLHPVYFNYNAFYHLVQGIALVLIFFSFRLLLRRTSF